jgi:uncharacterized membrane protein YtjA (UPF0391 family)
MVQHPRFFLLLAVTFGVLGFFIPIGFVASLARILCLIFLVLFSISLLAREPAPPVH